MRISGEKMQMKRTIVTALILSLLMLVSCWPSEELPDQPMVEFRSFTLFDTIDPLGNLTKAGRLTFYFEDGDGDLGIDPPNLPGDPPSNLFLQLYRMTNGTFVMAKPGEPQYPEEMRIPFLEPGGQNPILKGIIDVTLMYLMYDPHDTLYYDFWIKDRSGNESNTESTCVFVLGENGTCTNK